MSYQYVSGDLFQSKANILVNPVNLKGAMGKGLALAFKQKDPQMYQQYRQQCLDGTLRQHHYQIAKFQNRYVLNLPTKDDWRDNSQLKLIDEGLRAFVKNNANRQVDSIAIPKIGAGLGRLDFEHSVAPVLEKHLGGRFADKVDVQVVIDNDPQMVKRLNQNYLAKQNQTDFAATIPAKHPTPKKAVHSTPSKSADNFKVQPMDNDLEF